jgi:pimeloyl-ACP methyl ester carboxylesterase
MLNRKPPDSPIPETEQGDLFMYGKLLAALSIACIFGLIITAACVSPSGSSPPPAANATRIAEETIQQLKSQYPPPGSLIDVGGYRLHLNCRGAGTPVVVMEAGAGNGAESWALVSPAVANMTRVCVYDRAGFGWSDPATENLTVARVVRNLHTLLERSGEKPPYVLAGHSIAGLYARSYIHRYPLDAAGLVLIDPSHERQLVSVTDEYHREQAGLLSSISEMHRANAAIAAQGVLAENLSLVPQDERLPLSERRANQVLLAIKPSIWESSADEFGAIDALSEEVRAENITSLGNIPLVVLIAGNPQDLSASPDLNNLAQSSYRTLKMELAQESPQGSWVIVNESGHYIQLDRPEIVIETISGVIRKVRTAGAGN